MSMTMVPKQQAAPPRQMSREDRRIVFEKLNDVYIDEKSGYSAPWTDKAVAENLGIPQAWVATIRDENFGPVASNAKIDEEVEKAIEFIVNIRKEAGVLAGLANTMIGKAGDLEKRIIDIQKAVRP